jgi:hypothetical protein
MSLHESIQMQRTYGSAANAEYANGYSKFHVTVATVVQIESVRRGHTRFVDSSGGQSVGCNHRRSTHKTVRGDGEIMLSCLVVHVWMQAAASGVDPASSSSKDNIDFDSLRTLSDQGFDISFLDNIGMC